MKAFAAPTVDEPWPALLARAERKIARERAARLEAEAIAEKGLRDLYDTQQRLLLLQRVTEGANKACDVDSALRLALTEFGGHSGWTIGNAYLRDGDRVVACADWCAVETHDLREFVEASIEACFQTGVGLPGRILADPRPHWIEDVTTDGNFPRAEAARRCGVVSACAFPVLVGDEVAAVLEFFTRKTVTACADMLAIMGQIGTQLGRVIERERAQRALLHDALHDAMTGLPNRVLLQDRLGHAFERVSRRPDEQLALLVIDLDGFKDVNDALGHQAGDKLLIQVAGRMRGCLDRCEDHARTRGDPLQVTIARTGGDEFVVLLDGVMTPEDGDRVAGMIHDALRAPLSIDGRLMQVGASIGLAYHRRSYADADQLVRDADLAMYHAKTNGRGRTVVFSDDLGKSLRSAQAFEQELRDAIHRHEFVLYYQPIVTFGDGAQVQGFEALLRWNHPTRGLLSPDAFIEMAETTGLVLPIGDWVLREACKTVAGWHLSVPHRDPFISINISPKQFLQPEFAQRVIEIMLETGIRPTSVRLEVTEGVAIIDADRTRQVVGDIRSWGVKTSLDDFGTGFSSLSYLQTLPFDSIKIDRSFVSAINSSPKDEGIVRAILDLARTMDMKVVAEGVETFEQEMKLAKLGCDLGQGYLYSRPIAEADAFAMLASNGRIPAII